MSSKRTIRPSPIPSGAEDIWKKYFSVEARSLINPYPFSVLKLLDTPFQRFGRNIFLFRRGYHDILELDLDFGRSWGGVSVIFPFSST